MMLKYGLTLILLSGLLFKAEAQNRKIIDVHFHTRSAGDYGTPPPPNPISGKAPNAASDEVILKTNLALLQKFNVVKAICSGTVSRNNAFIAKDPTRFISALEYPDHENNPLPDIATFEKMIMEKHFFAFGELGLQYDGKTLDQPEFEPYLAVCEKLGIPVMVHTGLAAPETPYHGFPNFTIASGNPLTLEPVLKKHPKLKVQIMHMGYPYLQEMKSIMSVYPQVYTDIAVIDWVLPKAEFNDYLQAMMKAGYGKRIMYGSDQMIWEDAIPLSIQMVETATFLTEPQKQDIFYNNAARFFGIK